MKGFKYFCKQNLFRQNDHIILHNQHPSIVVHSVCSREGHREIHQEQPGVAQNGTRQNGQRDAVLWRHGRGTGEGTVRYRRLNPKDFLQPAAEIFQFF